ncbi:MAG: amidohydrolase family protein, partial [Nitrospinae bacterium]|nr:amidohydrolase family protein [Nitrospinota bacterium]
MQHERRIVKIVADWVLPISSPPFKDGAVVIEGDTIKAVGKKKDLLRLPYDETVDCSGKILMPGLINAHAHLELTGFRDRITKGLPFADWAREVVAIRKGLSEKGIISAIENGLNELMSSGVTAIGDFSQTKITGRILKEKGLRGIVFLEFSR